MNTIINERNLKIAHKEGIEGEIDFNCWGATLFVLGIVEELYWVENSEIEEFIDNETEEVDKKDIRAGDVLVLYYGGSSRISHTAIFISKIKLFHKPGNGNSEFTSEKGVRELYSSSKECKYFRFKGNE